MTLATVLNIVLTLSGVLAGVFGGWLARPKVVAEATKAKAEAVKTAAESVVLDWGRFQSEIARQDAKIAAMEEKLLRQDAEIENLKHDRDDRDGALIVERKENKALKAHVAKLEKRLAELEAIFASHVLTPEMRAALDKLKDK